MLLRKVMIGLGAVVSSALAQSLVTISVGPGGTCPAIPIVTVGLQPVLYRESIPYNTVIDPFRNQQFLTVTNAPVFIEISNVLTSTYPTSGSPAKPSSSMSIASTTTERGNSRTSSLTAVVSSSSSTRSLPDLTTTRESIASSTRVIGSTMSNSPRSSSVSEAAVFASTTAVVSSPASLSSPVLSQKPLSSSSMVPSFSQLSSTQLSTSSPPTQPTSRISAGSILPSTSVSTVTSNLAGTTLAATILTNEAITAATSAAITSSPPQEPPPELKIGVGVEPGVVTSQDFIILAIDIALPDLGIDLAQRRKHPPRQDDGQPLPDTTAISLVDVSSSANQSSINQDNCDVASPLSLNNGRLEQAGKRIGKPFGATKHVLGLVTESTDPEAPEPVTELFYLENGMLVWNATDFGNATFYNCQGTIEVGFPDSSDASVCVQIVVGAIGGASCRRRVEATATVNPIFNPELTTYVPPATADVSVTQSSSLVDSAFLTSTRTTTVFRRSRTPSPISTLASPSASSILVEASISALPNGTTTLLSTSLSTPNATSSISLNTTLSSASISAATSSTLPPTSTTSCDRYHGVFAGVVRTPTASLSYMQVGSRPTSSSYTVTVTATAITVTLTSTFAVEGALTSFGSITVAPQATMVIGDQTSAVPAGAITLPPAFTTIGPFITMSPEITLTLPAEATVITQVSIEVGSELTIGHDLDGSGPQNPGFTTVTATFIQPEVVVGSPIDINFGQPPPAGDPVVIGISFETVVFQAGDGRAMPTAGVGDSEGFEQ